MPTMIDLTNNTYGSLKVLSKSETQTTKDLTWLCLCKCGKLTHKQGNHLRGNKIHTCGNCNFKEDYPKEYKAWQNMKERCYRVNGKDYHNYGGRGITVCLEWKYSFLAFLEHVGLAPSPTLSIDRINNEGNYEPDNVRWATSKEQANNRR